MDKPIQSSDSGVILIPRVTFNYVVIAVAFLLLGIVLGAVGYERFVMANSAAVEQSVVRALSGDSGVQAAIERSIASALGGDQADSQPRLVPNERYDIPVTNSPSLGPADAPVTMVEFSDFRCSYCGRFARETLRPLLAAYGDQLQFVYRDFVIFGQPSYEAALAAACAGDQNQFWEFHDRIFDNQQALSRDLYTGWADELSMDVETFNTCMAEETHRQNIVDDFTFGQSLGLTGTPTFFINGRAVSGAQPLEVFKRIIDEELATASASLG